MPATLPGTPVAPGPVRTGGLIMMKSNLVHFRAPPLRAIRRVNPSQSTESDDASFWAHQMERVASCQDVDCFMRIYDYYAPRVHRYLLGMNANTAQAEELVQEAMLRVWRHASRFNGDQASLPTWLFRIARNLHVDSLRHQGHRVAFEQKVTWELQETSPETDGPEAFSDHAELARAIDALPADQARMIRMSYLESKSHSEIAAELGLPLGTVKSTLRRSFEKLKNSMGSSP